MALMGSFQNFRLSQNLAPFWVRFFSGPPTVRPLADFITHIYHFRW